MLRQVQSAASPRSRMPDMVPVRQPLSFTGESELPEASELDHLLCSLIALPQLVRLLRDVELQPLGDQANVA